MNQPFSPDILNDIEEVKRRDRLPLNDHGHAERLQGLLDGRVIYVPGRGWAGWTGTHFSFSEGAAMLFEAISALPDVLEKDDQLAMVAYRVAIEESYKKYRSNNEEDEDYIPILETTYIVKKDFQHVLKREIRRLGQEPTVTRLFNAMKRHVSVPAYKLDARPDLFATRNGVIDLQRYVKTKSFPANQKQTDEAMADWASAFFQPAQQSDLITRRAFSAYDPTAKAPKWRAFIQKILPDPEIAACLQRCLGATLVGRNDAQVMLLFRGDGGNGKSTLLNAVTRVLGGYAETVEVEIFLRGPPSQAGRARPEEANVPGARLLVASETSIYDRLSGKAVKAFTGGDKRRTRDLYEGAFTYTPTAIPVLQFNRIPMIEEDDEGLRRRLVFVPFTQKLHRLPSRQRRTSKQMKAAFDAELSGILNWLLVGYRDFATRLAHGQGDPAGIDPPPSMLALKAEAMEDSDPIGAFMAQALEPEDDQSILLAAFVDRYNALAEKTHGAKQSSRIIAKTLRAKDISLEKRGGNMQILGYRWLTKGP